MYYLLRFECEYEANPGCIAFLLLDQERYDLFLACGGKDETIPISSENGDNSARLDKVLPLDCDSQMYEAMAPFVESPWIDLDEWIEENAPVYLLRFAKLGEENDDKEPQTLVLTYDQYHKYRDQLKEIAVEGVVWRCFDVDSESQSDVYDKEGNLSSDFGIEAIEWMEQVWAMLK